jgi:inhibitor of KinA sporulation pathway (predicted exonuclease)
LSEFCYTLTGIGQDVVDASDPFPVVHEKFLRWMRSHSLGITKSFSIVTVSLSRH